MSDWLWIDDERRLPSNWEPTDEWAKTSAEAISMLKAKQAAGERYYCISFDHDLGYSLDDGNSENDGGYHDDTTRPVMQWLADNNFWPDFIVIHSRNPIGARRLEQMALHDGPKTMHVLVEPYSVIR